MRGDVVGGSHGRALEGGLLVLNKVRCRFGLPGKCGSSVGRCSCEWVEGRLKGCSFLTYWSICLACGRGDFIGMRYNKIHEKEFY